MQNVESAEVFLQARGSQPAQWKLATKDFGNLANASQHRVARSNTVSLKSSYDCWLKEMNRKYDKQVK